MYLEIDSIVHQIDLEVKSNQNRTEEKISESNMTTMQSTTINIPASSETKFNYTTNQFETIQIPARTETVMTPVTTNSQSLKLSHTIFNQFNWAITSETANKIIHAKTVRLKLYQENNESGSKSPNIN